MVGVLWYDPSGSLEERVKRAAERFAKKTGRLPNICLHSFPDAPEQTLDGVRLEYSKTIMKNHLLVGVEN